MSHSEIPGCWLVLHRFGHLVPPCRGIGGVVLSLDFLSGACSSAAANREVLHDVQQIATIHVLRVSQARRLRARLEPGPLIDHVDQLGSVLQAPYVLDQNLDTALLFLPARTR